jgi:hypothetical protein
MLSKKAAIGGIVNGKGECRIGVCFTVMGKFTLCTQQAVNGYLYPPSPSIKLSYCPISLIQILMLG